VEGWGGGEGVAYAEWEVMWMMIGAAVDGMRKRYGMVVSDQA
jgi:hypothetical protein